MQPFVGNVVNKLDAKGRVSVPAPFRTILAAQNLRGVYCIPSFHAPALEAFGDSLIAVFQSRIGKRDALFDPDYDVEADAVLGHAQLLNLDDEGRIRIPDELLGHASIADRITFIGLGAKFQMWDPARYEPVQRERRERARVLRSGGQP